MGSRGGNKKREPYRMLCGWGGGEKSIKRIKGRGYHGQGSVKTEDRFGVKENHYIVENFLMKKY